MKKRFVLALLVLLMLLLSSQALATNYTAAFTIAQIERYSENWGAELTKEESLYQVTSDNYLSFVIKLRNYTGRDYYCEPVAKIYNESGDLLDTITWSLSTVGPRKTMYFWINESTMKQFYKAGTYVIVFSVNDGEESWKGKVSFTGKVSSTY